MKVRVINQGTAVLSAIIMMVLSFLSWVNAVENVRENPQVELFIIPLTFSLLTILIVFMISEEAEVKVYEQQKL